MNIIIFSGTKNGRDLINVLLKDKHTIYVSSFSEHGTKLLPNSKNLIKFTGKKTSADIIEIIRTNNIDLVLDCTHPYASEISENIILACSTLNQKVIRFERESTLTRDIGKHFNSISDMCHYLNETTGNILFTTGIKDLTDIVSIVNRKRVYTRILPIKSSWDIVFNNSLDISHVIEKNPPFSLIENLEHIKKFNIQYLVTKDSGKEGFVDEKVEACNMTSTNLLVLDRPKINYDTVFYLKEDIIKYINSLS